MNEEKFCWGCHFIHLALGNAALVSTFTNPLLGGLSETCLLMWFTNFMRFVGAVEFILCYSPAFNCDSRVIALYAEIMLALYTQKSVPRSRFRGWLDALGCCL